MAFALLNFSVCRTLESLGNDGSAIYLNDGNTFENRCTFMTVFSMIGRTSLNGRTCTNVEWYYCNIVNNTCVVVIYQYSGMCNLTRCVIFGNKNVNGNVVGLASTNNFYWVSLCAFDFTPSYVNWSSNNAWPTVTATNTLIHRDAALCRLFYTPTAIFIHSYGAVVGTATIGVSDKNAWNSLSGSQWQPVSENHQQSHLQSSAIVSVTLEFAMSLSDPDRIEKLMRTGIGILKTGIFETDKFRATNDGSPQTAARSNDIGGIANSVEVWVIVVAIIGTLLLIVVIFGLICFSRRVTPSQSGRIYSTLTLKLSLDEEMTDDYVTHSEISLTNSMFYRASAIHEVSTIEHISGASLPLD
jgi:hypothetical protein